MNARQIILQGGGEHAKVVLDGLLSQKQNVIALFDPKFSGNLLGVEQRGAYDPSFCEQSHVIVAIGDNRTRRQVALITHHSFTNFIHSSAIISPNSKLGEGCMIMHGTIIQVHTQLGNHVIVNSSASIDHDCRIGDYVHVAPRAVLCGRVIVGEGVLIGAGAVVLPGIQIGNWAIVGAGAVVTKNVMEGEVVVGNPARVIKTLTNLK